MQFAVQGNSVAGFHHRLSVAVSSVTGEHQVISLWRPNSGLIKQQLLFPPFPALYPPWLAILIWEWLADLNVSLGEVFFQNTGQKSHIISIIHYMRRFSHLYVEKQNKMWSIYTGI